MNRTDGRRAFTIAEVVVSVGILAILATIIIPTATRYLYNKEIKADALILDSLVRAKMAFQNDILFYPGRLSQLATAISTSDETLCNGVFPSTALVRFSAAQTNAWNGLTSAPLGAHAGPFFGRAISRSGFPLSIGIANDVMTRSGGNGTAGFMFIRIPEVTYADALALNAYVDGTGFPGPGRTDTAGTVRWSTTPSGPRDTVTLNWVHGIRNGC